MVRAVLASRRGTGQGGLSARGDEPDGGGYRIRIRLFGVATSSARQRVVGTIGDRPRVFRFRRAGNRALPPFHLPILALGRLLWAQPAERRGQGRALHAAPKMQRLIYQLPKPRPDGQAVLSLMPMELLERLAAPIPPPRRHRRSSHGVLAPHRLPGSKRDSASWC
jgi:hypothetical protein